MQNYTTISKEILQLDTIQAAIYITLKRSRKAEGYSDLFEAQIAEYSGLSLDTVKHAKLAEFLPLVGVEIRKVKSGVHYRNTYYFQAETDFFFVDNSFFEEVADYRERVFLLKLKALCLNNTNRIHLTKKELAKRLNISRPTLDKYLSTSKGVKAENNGFLLVNRNIYTEAPKTETVFDKTFALITEFSKLKQSALPERDERVLADIVTKYSGDNKRLLKDLCERLQKLPKQVTLAYFLKALRNRKRDNKETINEFKI